jgi:class 3 adenylate cyclase
MVVDLEGRAAPFEGGLDRRIRNQLALPDAVLERLLDAVVVGDAADAHAGVRLGAVGDGVPHGAGLGEGSAAERAAASKTIEDFIAPPAPVRRRGFVSAHITPPPSARAVGLRPTDL